jgi:purine-binding chemotaxis protein CheW
VTIATSATSTRYLTFEVNANLYALRAEEIQEVIRLPAMARVPQGPPALLGVANLRGIVLPVASLSVMLGEVDRHVFGSAIVLDGGSPVAIAVDAVAALESPDPSQIERQEKDAADDSPHQGAFAVPGTQRVARILDIKALLNAAFARRAASTAHPRQRAMLGNGSRNQAVARQSAQMLVTFDVAGQEYALPVTAVREILPVPAELTRVARSDAAVLGITSVRNRLLPLLSLRNLLGFSAAAETVADRQKVVVVNMGESQVGLVADRARAIVAAADSLVDPVPPVLAARTGGESRIRAVYRADGGKRLISILAPEQLFRNEIMQTLTQGRDKATAASTPASPGAAELIFLVFRLGGEEFGLPIDTVVEVAQVPQQITRLPRTPKFLEGVANLRGETLPIVDQRRRFDMPALASAEGRRLVVIRTARHRAGIIVDAVSDVLRTTAANIEPAPDLTDAVSRLVSGILNLASSQRMVLLLDPAELLTRAEQGLLDAFQSSRKKANA